MNDDEPLGGWLMLFVFLLIIVVGGGWLVLRVLNG